MLRFFLILLLFPLSCEKKDQILIKQDACILKLENSQKVLVCDEKYDLTVKYLESGIILKQCKKFKYLVNNKKFQVYSFDPFAKNWTSEFRKKYNLIGSLENKKFDVVVLAVKHSKFLKIKSKIKKLLNQSGFIYDLKYLFNEQPNIYRL